MKYRISVDKRAERVVEAIEVDAIDLATAIFLAGMQMAHNSNPVGPVQVVKAQVPGGWMEVELP